MKRQEIYLFLFFLQWTIFTLCQSVTNGRCLLTVSACICFSLFCTKCIYRLRSSSSVSPKEKPHWLHWGLVWYTRELHLFESVWLSVVSLLCVVRKGVRNLIVLHPMHKRLLPRLFCITPASSLIFKLGSSSYSNHFLVFLCICYREAFKSIRHQIGKYPSYHSVFFLAPQVF